MSARPPIEALRLFNEMAEELHGSRFTQALNQGVVGTSLKMHVGEPIEVTRTGPDLEAVRAFVLTFRLFIMNGDGISIFDMKGLYDSVIAPLDGPLVREFNEVRDALLEYLRRSTAVKFIESDGRERTRQRLFDVFMWGGLSHFNHRDVYEEWRQVPPVFADLENEFVLILREYLKVIAAIHGLNRRAIALLAPTPGA
jgi:hypothetical protein